MEQTYKGWKISKQHEGKHWLAYNHEEVLRAKTKKKLIDGINGKNTLYSREWI